MSHEPPDPFTDDLRAQLEAALARAEAAEQKVKELEARVREAIEMMGDEVVVDEDFNGQVDGDAAHALAILRDALALVAEPEGPR